MQTQTRPTVVTFVVTHRDTRPTRVVERWRADFDLPARSSSGDIAIALLDELNGEKRPGVISRQDSTDIGIVELAVRTIHMARGEARGLLSGMLYPQLWDRVDFTITSYSHSPVDSRWLRLAIDAMNPQTLTVHFDDQGCVGRTQRSRTDADADPMHVAASEALNGTWRIGGITAHRVTTAGARSRTRPPTLHAALN